MKFKEYHLLDNTIGTFERLKLLSEQRWKNIELRECWGFQTQRNTKWRAGLNETELKKFENEMGFSFPESLKNYYRIMNGVDTLGINIHGDFDTDSPTYKPTFYSYPDDLELIKNQISWILESNGVSTADLNQGKAPYIFPFFGHRFIIIDQNEHVLSMYGNDIIPWEYNLARAIAKDIFKFTNGQNNLSNFQPVKFWLESLDLE